MAITMSEISGKLNISVATVSRALSDQPEVVAPETRRAILDLVERHGYQKRRTVGKSVAFIIDKALFNRSVQFYNMIIAGVEQELIKQRFFFQFHSVEKGESDLEKVNLNFRDLAGVIDVGGYHDKLSIRLHRLGLSVVLIDNHIPTTDIPAVLIDNTDGLIQACSYLAKLGHKRVAFIGGDPLEITTQERLFGYRRAVDIYKLEREPGLVEYCGGRIDEAHVAMKRIWEHNLKPTAVVAHNDLIAIGVMDALKQKGLRVPADVSVVGFDDIRLSAEVVPSLTTIHVPKKTMGATAVQRLLRIIKCKQDPFHKVVLPTRLVTRGSTAKYIPD